MKISISYIVYRISLSVLSAVLLILSFPNFNLYLLAWIALVPLSFAVENESPLKAFFISYLTGLLFFLGSIYWLIHVTLPGMIIVALYLALYFGVFGFVISYKLEVMSYKLKNRNYGLLFFIPALWVSLEWIRSTGPAGFGWAIFAHSQSQNLPIIQIADIFGAYGVSFLIVMVNAAIFFTIKNFKNRQYHSLHIAVTLFLIFLCLSYGVFRLKNIFTGERLMVAVVQGNIPQVKKWDPEFRDEILIRYEQLTKDAAKTNPDLIIWPETSVPGFLETEKDLLDRIKSLAKTLNTPLLVGAPREENDLYYNSAIFFGEDGEVIEHYDKIHLVPFGEYIPLKRIFSFVENFAPSPIGDFSAGKDYTVFKFFIERAANDKDFKWKLFKKAKFSSLICFEDIFPGLTREFIKKDANFLVNITNDAWFGNSSAPYQHAQSSVFRAVENRVNIVRAANTGFSCFIDQKGRVVNEVKSDGKNLFVEGFTTHGIILTKTKTIYTTYGDIFAYLCIVFTLLNLVTCLPARCPLPAGRDLPG